MPCQAACVSGMVFSMRCVCHICRTLTISHLSLIGFAILRSGAMNYEAPSSRAPTDRYSTLTHTLPLVSKKFHKLATGHDLYWKAAFLRLIDRDPSIWEDGLRRLIFDAKCDELRTSMAEWESSRASARAVRRDKRVKNDQLNQPAPQATEASQQRRQQQKPSPSERPSSSLTEGEELLQNACVAIQSDQSRHHHAAPSPDRIYRSIYESVVRGHLRFQAPVFFMPTRITLGSPYGLHLFEPRYRLLIGEVMRPYPVSARRGEPIAPLVPGIFPPRRPITEEMKGPILNLLEESEEVLRNYHLPTFVHAHQLLETNAPAAIVQVVRCEQHPNGTADVFLLPVGYMWIEETWERPGTGALYEARGIRMGDDECQKYELWSKMGGLSSGDGRGRANQLPIP